MHAHHECGSCRSKHCDMIAARIELIVSILANWRMHAPLMRQNDAECWNMIENVGRVYPEYFGHAVALLTHSEEACFVVLEVSIVKHYA